jgi:hypothetical protein
MKLNHIMDGIVVSKLLAMVNIKQTAENTEYWAILHQSYANILVQPMLPNSQIVSIASFLPGCHINFIIGS